MKVNNLLEVARLGEIRFFIGQRQLDYYEWRDVYSDGEIDYTIDELKDYTIYDISARNIYCLYVYLLDKV